MTAVAAPPGADKPRILRPQGLPADKLFRGVARGSGITVLVLMSMVGLFLGFRAWQAISDAGFGFVTTQAWEPDSHHFGIAAIVVGTILIGVTAIFFAVPLAVGTALYISEYAPKKIQRALISIVDLMAAVPSVVYGLWGAFFFQSQLAGFSKWVATYLGWIPFFHVDGFHKGDAITNTTVFKSSTLIAGVVVALMVTPIMCSIMREAFQQAPLGEREGAYALGATKWGMIRSVVLPFGKGGIIGATMLGLGRALGETIAVFMIINPVFVIQPHILESGASSVSALIALRYGDATKFGTSALMAAGLALFVMTLIVNFIASSIVANSRSGAASDA